MNNALENPEKILFVDDEESILKIASEYFKHKGYQVFTASNGLEAVKLLKNQKVDCCFTDINMPKMDGLALAEHIHHVDNTLPVIIMTGYPSLDNTIRTLKNGVVDFLIKPVNLKQMELSVRRVFQQRRLFVENVLLQKEVESKARIEKLNQELLVKIEELNIFNKILSDFGKIGSSSNVFEHLVDLAIEITHADGAGFYIINENDNRPIQVVFATDPRIELDNSALRSLKSAKPGATTRPACVQDVHRCVEKMVMEIAGDQIPLLITENCGTNGLPDTCHSMMMTPLKIREKVFGVLMALNEQRKNRFSEKDLYYLSFMSQNAANAIENLALYENIYENLFATLYAFVNAIEARDAYTQQHSSRVTRISITIGKALGCDSEELDTLNFAGHLHDIGKIGIRDDILLKPGRLTPEEFNKIKEHPVIGANIVKQLGFWDRERQIIRCHHERFDGGGYPDGLAGEKIPFLARVLSVADVFDAISSDRAYRKKMEEALVLKIISEGAGTQFDPEIVNAFLQLYKDGAFRHIIEYEPAENASDTSEDLPN